MTHKGEDYKLSAIEYYLTEDNSQKAVCLICCLMSPLFYCFTVLTFYSNIIKQS